MPDRIVKAAIIRSVKVNSLSWQAECMYRRLMNVVDDFGLYYANPMVLRADLFPMKLDKVRESDVTKWLAECSAAQLVAIYEVAGERYLKMHNTDKPRAKKSKYPQPNENVCKQMNADANKSPVVVDVGVSDVVGDIAHSKKSTEYSDSFLEFWKLYPRREGKGRASAAWNKLDLLHQRKAMLSVHVYAAAVAKWSDEDKGFVPHPTTWLNERRWEDDPKEWERSTKNNGRSFDGAAEDVGKFNGR